MAIPDGQGAVAWANQYQPAQVVLDLDLPDISGVAVALILRARYGPAPADSDLQRRCAGYARTRHLGPCGLIRTTV